jgi:hypothetical protein
MKTNKQNANELGDKDNPKHKLSSEADIENCKKHHSIQKPQDKQDGTLATDHNQQFLATNILYKISDRTTHCHFIDR